MVIPSSYYQRSHRSSQIPCPLLLLGSCLLLRGRFSRIPTVVLQQVIISPWWRGIQNDREVSDKKRWSRIFQGFLFCMSTEHSPLFWLTSGPESWENWQIRAWTSLPMGLENHPKQSTTWRPCPDLGVGRWVSTANICRVQVWMNGWLMPCSLLHLRWEEAVTPFLGADGCVAFGGLDFNTCFMKGWTYSSNLFIMGKSIQIPSSLTVSPNLFHHFSWCFNKPAWTPTQGVTDCSSQHLTMITKLRD